MFSGKTRRLIEAMEKAYANGEQVLVVRPSLDLRGGAKSILDCRAKKDEPLPPASVLRVSFLHDIRMHLNKFSSSPRIIIDEGQFFPDLAEECVWLADIAQLHVAVAALNSDFRHRGWPAVEALMSVVDTIIWADDAVCDVCKKRRACFTQKRASADFLKIVDIGDSDKYFPVCRKCSFASSSSTPVPDKQSTALRSSAVFVLPPPPPPPK